MVKTLSGHLGMKNMANSGIGMVQKLVKIFYLIESTMQERTILKSLMIQTQVNT